MTYHKNESESKQCPICNPTACSEAVLSEAHSNLEMAKSRVFILTKTNVIDCAKQMGMSEEDITDEVLEQVKKGVEWGMECWTVIVKEAINLALKL